MSIEQMCRDLLEVAIREGLVAPSPDWEIPDPQCRTSGELAGMANRLSFFFTQKSRDKYRDHGSLPPIHESGPIYPGM